MTKRKAGSNDRGCPCKAKGEFSTPNKCTCGRGKKFCKNRAIEEVGKVNSKMK